MKAHIPLPRKTREEIKSYAASILTTAQQDNNTRLQCLWMLAMLQAGLTKEDITRTAEALTDIIIPKYKEYKTDRLADVFAQVTLEDNGLTPPKPTTNI